MERRDQHDCFSSLTLEDYDRDARGIQGIYLGKYGSKSGPSISSLVATVDKDLDAKVQKQLQASVDAIDAVPKPFEKAIIGADSDPGRTKIRAAVSSLRAQGDLMADAAAALGLTIKVPDSND
jgi:putative iron-regulated protein